MADFFFYTDLEKLNLQSAAESFGPIDTNKYNISNKHTATSDTNAYAVTDGVICVQKQNGVGGLLNIILKPFYQPKDTLPVKYFVYRNIDPDSLIDTTNNTLLAAASSNKLLSDIYNDPKITPKNSAILGIDLNSINGFVDTDQIDKLFFDNGVSTSQLYVVKQGWSIGKFKSTGFSFEIYTDNIGFSPNLGFVRNSTIPGILDVTNSSTTATAYIQAFEKQCAKEALFNFTDPVCFYGSLVSNSIDNFFINNAPAPAITDNTNFTNKTTTIYADFLSKTCVHNKNYIYIDLRDEHNSSYDYQRRYGTLSPGNSYTHSTILFNSTDLQTPSMPSSHDFYNEFNWPILRLNSDPAIQYVTDPTKTSLTLAISFPIGINTKPLIHQAYGNVPTGGKLYDTMFSPIPDTTNVGYLMPVNIRISIDSSLNIIPSYQQLKYIFEQVQVQDPLIAGGNYSLAGSFFSDTSLNGLEPLDNIFQPFIIKESGATTVAEETYYIPWAVGTAPLLANIYADKTIIDTSRFSNKVISASKGIGRINNNYINFFCHANENNETNDALIPDISPVLYSKLNLPIPVPTMLPTFLSYLSLYANTISNTPTVINGINSLGYSYADITSPVVKRIERLDIKNDPNIPPSTYSDFLNIDITIADWTSIKAKAAIQSFLKNTKVYLGLKFIQQNITQGILADGTATRMRYIRYEIVLRGYIKDVTNNKIILTEINNLSATNSPVYYFYAVNELVADDFDLIQKRGNRHSINILPVSETSDFMIYNIQEQHTIETQLCLIRGGHVSSTEYVKYLNYFRRNIRKVWTSATKITDTFGNKGLVGLEVPNSFTPIKVRISTDPDPTAPTLGVQFKQSTTLNYSKLNRNQNFVYVTKSLLTRSFYSGDALMYMIYNEIAPGTAPNYIESTPNVPAHEFGHLLGLVDRYTYLALAKFTQPSTVDGNANDLYFGQPASIKNQFKVNPFYGKNTPLFLPRSYDDEYGINYGWHHNLMSTQNIVPDISLMVATPPVRAVTGNAFDYVALDYESDYRAYFTNNAYLPTNLASGDYGVVCVFITNTQWSFIYDVKNERGTIYTQNLFQHNATVFFKNSDQVTAYPTTSTNYYTGSFTGLALTENNSATPSPNPNFDPSFNTLNDITPPQNIHHYFINLDNYFGTNTSNGKYPYALVTDDGMATLPVASLRDIEKRILRASGKFIDNIQAYVNPTYVSNHIVPRPITLLSYLYRFETTIDSQRPLIVNADMPQFLSFLEMGDNSSGLLIRAILERELIGNTARNVTIKPFVANPNPSSLGGGIMNFVDARYMEPSTAYILHDDDFAETGETGGKIILWNSNVGKRTIYDETVVPPNVSQDAPFTSARLYNSGRLLWNYFEVTPNFADDPLFSYRYYHTIFLKQKIGWNAYTNRNIILYLIQNAIIDQPGNQNIFRNHRGFTYTGITDFNGDGEVIDDNQ